MNGWTMAQGLGAFWVALTLLPGTAAASLEIPSGAGVDLAGGSIDFAGGDLVDLGALSLNGGQILGAGAFRVLTGGTADLTGGLVQAGGDWVNLGGINTTGSSVELRDGAAPASSLLGTTTFHNLSLVSSSGKRYRLQSGLTQHVGGLLEIRGLGPPIQVDVTMPGVIAFLDLVPGGTQSIANVGVSDVFANGQHLAPTQTNQGGNNNDQGWFGKLFGASTPVPALSAPAMLFLMVVTLLLGMRLSRRRLESHHG
ncbi:MAG: hypothetical protein J0L91_04555 [Burkholderiales bacterium]|nr:hypothetical protein [Burkholderiales bacterium]